MSIRLEIKDKLGSGIIHFRDEIDLNIYLEDCQDEWHNICDQIEAITKGWADRVWSRTGTDKGE